MTTDNNEPALERADDLFLRWWRSQSLDSEPERSRLIAQVAFKAGILAQVDGAAPTVANFEAWTSIDAWLRENPTATGAECIAELARRIQSKAATAPAEQSEQDCSKTLKRCVMSADLGNIKVVLERVARCVYLRRTALLVQRV